MSLLLIITILELLPSSCRHFYVSEGLRRSPFLFKLRLAPFLSPFLSKVRLAPSPYLSCGSRRLVPWGRYHFLWACVKRV